MNYGQFDYLSIVFWLSVELDAVDKSDRSDDCQRLVNAIDNSAPSSCLLLKRSLPE